MHSIGPSCGFRSIPSESLLFYFLVADTYGRPVRLSVDGSLTFDESYFRLAAPAEVLDWPPLHLSATKVAVYSALFCTLPILTYSIDTLFTSQCPGCSKTMASKRALLQNHIKTQHPGMAASITAGIIDIKVLSRKSAGSAPSSGDEGGSKDDVMDDPVDETDYNVDNPYYDMVSCKFVARVMFCHSEQMRTTNKNAGALCVAIRIPLFVLDDQFTSRTIT